MPKPPQPLRFFVPGLPAPQGSKNVGNHGQLYESSKALGPWRDSVHHAARFAADLFKWECATTAVELAVVFYLPRPASVSAKKRPLPSVKPDLSKLVRAVEDALTTAAVIRDDALIVNLGAWKCYTTPGDEVGARVQVQVLQP